MEEILADSGTGAREHVVLKACVAAAFGRYKDFRTGPFITRHMPEYQKVLKLERRQAKRRQKEQRVNR